MGVAALLGVTGITHADLGPPLTSRFEDDPMTHGADPVPWVEPTRPPGGLRREPQAYRALKSPAAQSDRVIAKPTRHDNNVLRSSRCRALRSVRDGRAYRLPTKSESRGVGRVATK
jgi:hypothetical protein